MQEYFESVKIVRKSDGSVTINPGKIDEVLRQAWGKIMCRFKDSPEPNVSV